MEIKEFIVEEELVNERIDKGLVKLIPDLSRSKISELIDLKQISVNNKFVASSYKLKLNDKIKIVLLDSINNEIEPEDIPLDIVYDDEDLMIINKPAGMVVHPANGHYEHTLVNALMYHFNNLSTVNGPTRPGIVHRLDKETSGLIMVAKSDFAHNEISNQLKSKTAFRKYVALLHHELPHNEGTIVAPIARNKHNRLKMAVVESGKDATTHFRVIERFSDYTLVECFLETGRTHQIRVHFATLGFPVVGDVIYGPKKPAYDYQLLHAKALGLVSPSRKEKIYTEIPLPDYFEEALKNLRTYGKLKKEN